MESGQLGGAELGCPGGPALTANKRARGGLLGKTGLGTTMHAIHRFPHQGWIVGTVADPGQQTVCHLEHSALRYGSSSCLGVGGW